MAVAIIMLSVSWAEESAGSGTYTQSVTISGLSATDIVIVSLSSSASTAQREAAATAKLAAVGQSANTLVFRVYDAAPTVDIPVAITILPV